MILRLFTIPFQDRFRSNLFGPGGNCLLGTLSSPIYSCKYQPGALTEMVNFLSKRKTLTLIEITSCSFEFPKKEIKQCVRLCQLIRNVTHLTFDYTSLDESAYHIFEALKANTMCSLEKFSARYCHIKPSGCYSIAAYLKHSNSIL